MKNFEQTQASQQQSTNDFISVLELENFYNEMVEDWHLWDDRELGQYPIERTFDAMKKFIDYYKTKNNE